MAAPNICADCQVEDGVLAIRKRHLCHDCFVRYVNSKVFKRMDSYRFRYTENGERPRLLVPLSGGVCSLALLDTLDRQLQHQQAKRKRTSYDLLLMHVMLPGSDDRAQDSRWRESITTRFPAHHSLESIPLYQIFTMDSKVESDLQHLGIVRCNGLDDETFMQHIFDHVKTPSARADLEEILLRRLVIACGRQENCSGIAWGHSDSRMAAKVLADVAKGRGSSVPDHITDGPSLYGITFQHPVRDLFQSELELYLKSISVDLSDCLLATKEVDELPVSIRQTSIDRLLTNYINSQGEKYPGIMANVVRTAGKLQAPTEIDNHCAVCAMPITRTELSPDLCYGCVRMKQDIHTS